MNGETPKAPEIQQGKNQEKVDLKRYFEILELWLTEEATGAVDAAGAAAGRIGDRVYWFTRLTSRLLLIGISVPILLYITGLLFGRFFSQAVGSSILGTAGCFALIVWAAILYIFDGIYDAIAAAKHKASGKEGPFDRNKAGLSFRTIEGLLMVIVVITGASIIFSIWKNFLMIPVAFFFGIALMLEMHYWDFKFRVYRHVTFWTTVSVFVGIMLGAYAFPESYAAVHGKVALDHTFAEWAKQATGRELLLLAFSWIALAAAIRLKIKPVKTKEDDGSATLFWTIALIAVAIVAETSIWILVAESWRGWASSAQSQASGMSAPPWWAVVGIILLAALVFLMFRGRSGSGGESRAVSSSAYSPSPTNRASAIRTTIVLLLLVGAAAYFFWPPSMVKAKNLIAMATTGVKDLPSAPVEKKSADGRTMVIPANYPGFNTGRKLYQGEHFHWRFTGTVHSVRPGNQEYIPFGPNGWQNAPSFSPPRTYLAPDCAPMSAIGKEGEDGKWFCMGPEGEGVARRHIQDLIVGVNDFFSFTGGRRNTPQFIFSDNSGFFYLELN